MTGEIMPRGQEYTTVGQLYRGMAVFIGLPVRQATPERFHWPELIAVTDLQSALAAVEQVIEPRRRR